MCVRVVSNVKAVVAKELMSTWAIYHCAPCVSNYANKEIIVPCVRDVTTKMISIQRWVHVYNYKR